MKKLTLPDILKPYGIEGPTDLQKILGTSYDHAKKVWMGRLPISKSVARTLKQFTKGALSIDFLFSIEDGRK